jgi:hypothetical protein
LNINIGTKEAEKLKEKYIVLELDTVIIKSSTPITVYCVIENMPLDQMPKVEFYQELHDELMKNYRARRWDFCEQALKQLLGFWGQQVDTFYTIMHSRISDYQRNEPDESWTGIISK